VATRSKHPIATEEIPRIFDDACIEGLAQIGKLPASADMKRFAEGIRQAACIYATEVREPNDNEVRAEVSFRPEHFVFSNTRGGPEPIFHRPNPNRFSMYSITSRVSRRRSWSSMSPAAGRLPQSSSGQAPSYHRPKCYGTTRGARKRARRLLSSANMAGIGFRAASALQANGLGVGARIFVLRNLSVTFQSERLSERLACG